MSLSKSDLERETNDSHNTFYQNAIHFREREYALMKKNKCGIFSLVYVMKLWGHLTDIFSVGLQKTDKGLKTKLNLPPYNIKIYRQTEQ